MNRLRLVKIEQEERERTLSVARSAYRRQAESETSALDVLTRDIYQLDNIDSFIEAGYAGDLNASMGRVLITIYPYKTVERFERVYGYSVEELVDLRNAGHVEFLIQKPTTYEGLDFLDPIVELKPVSYWIRESVVFSWLAHDDPDFIVEPGCDFSPSMREYAEAARKMGPIRNAFEYREAWEPYQQIGAFGQEERSIILESFAWKYAQTRLLLGDEIVSWIMSEFEDIKALALLTHLHMRLEHPIAQGVFCAEQQFAETDYFRIAERVSSTMFSTLEEKLSLTREDDAIPSIEIPVRPKAAELDKIFARAGKRPGSEIFRVGDQTLNLYDLKTTLEEAKLQMEDAMAAIDRSTRKWKLRLNAIAALSTAALLNGRLFETVAGAGFSAGVSDILVNAFARAFKRLQRNRLTRLIWSLRINHRPTQR